VYNRLSQYFQTNIVLVPEQFDFRKGLTTNNTAFKLSDNVLNSINQKMHAGGIFCHLAKTSDCVNHKR
jgi:hypothetical protein